MKKFLALILSLAMVFALVACGGEKTDDSQKQRRRFHAPPLTITLATGGTTGTYYAVGNALVTTLDGKLTLSNLTAGRLRRFQGERPARSPPARLRCPSCSPTF